VAGFRLDIPEVEDEVARAQAENLPIAERHARQQTLREWYRNIVKPSYTCPMCRGTVGESPMECFGMKELIAQVAKLDKLDENVPADQQSVEPGYWREFFLDLPRSSN
jgi:hypothetical protein